MKLMKIFATLILIASYLLIIYIGFYHFIGRANLKSPYYLESGARSITFENPKQNGSVTYVAIGDSLSAGVGSDDIKQTFVYLYALKLSDTYRNVTFINLAWPGDMTADVLKNQLPNAVKEDPDYVTLLVGTNDIHNKVTLNDFKETYRDILNELLTKTGAHITIINIPYLGSNKIVYPPFNTLLNTRTRQFNEVIFNLIAELNDPVRIRFVDLYNSTYTYAVSSENYYSSDLFHPSSDGYALWEDIINAN